MHEYASGLITSTSKAELCAIANTENL